MKHARSLRGWELNDVANRIAEMDSGRSGMKTKPPARTFLSDIEKGKRSISPPTVGKLIHALDLPESWLDRFLDSAPDETDEETPKDREAEQLLVRVAKDETAPDTPEPLLIMLAEEWAGKGYTDPATAYTALRSALQAAQDMKDQIDRLHNMDDRLAAVLRRVAEMNDRGETHAAGQELDAAIKAKEAEVEALQDAALQQDRLRNDATTYAKRLVARLHAAAPPGGVFRASVRLLIEVRERGERQGDPFDLSVALALARINYDRARGPQLGQALLNLGNCHLAIGDRQSGTDHLTRAVRALASSLKESPRRRQPENWGISQNSLGNALQSLGEREGDSARLHDAVAAHRAALEVLTRDAARMDWAMTQNNLGNALQSLGGREGDTARLRDAIAAHRAALKVYTRDATPIDWAMAQNNVGNGLQTLGQRDGDTARLHEAVAAHRAALEVYTGDAAPMDWAATQNNLGLALRWLGTLTGEAAHLDAAEAALTDSLTVETRDAVPFPWAKTQWNFADLALARHALTPDPSLILRARDHLAQARAVFAEAENAHQLAECDRLQALIDAAESGDPPPPSP